MSPWGGGGAGRRWAVVVRKKDHSQASREGRLDWLWFLTGGCGQFRLVHRLFFNNLEK